MGAGRIKLSEKYQTEREEICKKLIEITGETFFLFDLDNDCEKQTAIIALKNEIEKYFAISTIAAFRPCLMKDVKREYMTILRAILKQQGYTIEGKNSFRKLNDEGAFQKTIKYKIFRNKN